MSVTYRRMTLADAEAVHAIEVETFPEPWSLQSFQESMGEVWTSTANIETIDECPQAYKPVSAITNCIGDTVDTAGRGIPAYNFKAAEEPFFGRKIKKQGEPLGEKCPRHNAV